MRKFALIFPTLLGLLVPCVAFAQEAGSDYTTKAGDDCVSIAVKAYGDRRAVELLHKSNPSMGPVPHVIKPGTVLHLPPKQGLGSAPDAHVTFVRNKVTVQANASKTAEVNDPLFRTNRVSTANASSANVTFRDETQIRIGEESLVIILGDVQGAAKKQPADATLVEGNLQARLGELSGKKSLTVDTDSGARVSMSSGSALVGVDATKTTRLAVHAGSAAFAAALATVSVPSGFGSKVDKGKAPTPPRPLPSPPAWSSPPPEVVFASAGKASVVATYADGALTGKPKATSFRVKVSRDAAMDDLVTDTVVPATVTKLDAQNLAPGAYYIRVAAIDDDKFESTAGATAKVIVVTATLAETGPGRARLAVTPAGAVCSLAGEPSTEDVDATRMHAIRCSIDAKDPYGRGGDVRAVPGDSTIPSIAKLFSATGSFREADPSTGRGTVVIELHDAGGAPVSAEGAKATASNGVEVESVATDGSVVSVTVRFPATPRPFVVTVTRGALVAESNVLRVPAPTADRPAGRVDTATPLPPRGYEIFLSGGLDTLFSGHAGRHLTLGTAYRIPIGSKAAISFGPSVTLSRFEPEPVSPGAFSPGPLGDTSAHTNVVLAIPVTLKLAPRARVSPYVSGGPELALQRTTFAVGTNELAATGTLVGAKLLLGVQVEAGPGWFFAHGGVRGMGVVSSDPAAESLSGATFDLGYRFTR